jgi:hypothetical protein
MGSIDEWFDLLDERRISTDEHERMGLATTINTSF